jgi:holin-like protein
MGIFKQLAIIIGCLAVGELVVWLTHVPVPSSILGMLLLTAMLQMKVVRLEWVESLSNFLVANMGFFFVPPGVALMLYFDVIRAEFWPIAISVVVSTILVMVMTGWSHNLTRIVLKKLKEKNTDNREER